MAIEDLPPGELRQRLSRTILDVGVSAVVQSPLTALLCVVAIRDTSGISVSVKTLDGVAGSEKLTRLSEDIANLIDEALQSSPSMLTLGSAKGDA